MSYVFSEDVIFNDNTQTFGDSFISGNINILGDLITRSVISSSIVKNGGTSSQFLKADGSIDETTYLTGATVGGTVDNIGGQIVVRSGTGGFSAGIITATTFVGNGTIPVGGIIMWSGTIANIPSGWALCNGSNGTPDLRNKFIIGSSVDDTGQSVTSITGSNTKTGGSKDAIVVSHNHTASTNTTGAHIHYVDGSNAVGGSGGVWAYDERGGAIAGTDVNYVKSAGDHSHTVTVDTNGSSGTNANLPPYYALAFIMRTS